ncbi:Telomerase reverse transcriptase [Diplodia seriata]
MLLDTSLNLESTVLGNLYRCFADAARKCFEYLKCLPAQKRNNDGLLISKCGLARIVDRVLCYRAFQSVFQRKQTKHALLLRWLAARGTAGKPRGAAERAALAQAVSA